MTENSRERLEQIVRYCRTYFHGHTMCGLTQDYVTSALAKNWDVKILQNPSWDDYTSPYWMRYIYYKNFAM